MRIKAIKEQRNVTIVGERQTRATANTGSTSNERFIEGYAATFNNPSKLIIEFDGGEMREFYEQLDPHSFDEVLASPDLDCTYNVDHNNHKLIARTKSGTLTLTVDEFGLKFKARIGNTSAQNDLYENIRLGNYSENSFCFSIMEADEVYTDQPDGSVLRTILKVNGLYDVSSVINPAYNGTSLSLRGMAVLKTRDEVNAPVAETPNPEPVVQPDETDLIDLDMFITINK